MNYASNIVEQTITLDYNYSNRNYNIFIHGTDSIIVNIRIYCVIFAQTLYYICVDCNDCYQINMLHLKKKQIQDKSINISV